MRRWNDEKIAAVRTNIFPYAWPAIRMPHNEFAWHTYAELPKSSQALAIDVFGAIRQHPQRNAVLAAIARELDLPSDGEWDVVPEWHDADNTLAERVVTQVDAAAIGASATILFECKFTEEGGGCSQTKPDKQKLVACSGAYAMQTNMRSGVDARCALTGKGIRYWDFIPEVYGVDAGTDREECPFRYDNYQWMRNVVLARSLALLKGKPVRVVAAYADAPFLKTAMKIKAGGLGHAPAKAEYAIIPLSYQRIIDIAEAAAPSEVWAELRRWVLDKIELQRPV